MIDVCFVLMPYASIQRPSIALGLLKSSLKEYGINSLNLYANIWFAHQIGLENYNYFQNSQPINLLGEWTFSQAAFPDFQTNDEEFLKLATGISQKKIQNPIIFNKLKKMIKESRRKANPFIDKVAQHIIQLQPRILASSSTFEQHCPSLALLKRIRELNPEIVTFMGGANCEGVMGQTTKREFPWVDFVISGEGDRVVPELCSQILEKGREIEVEKLPYGVISAKNCDDYNNNFTDTRAFVENLDKISFPDYDDYFETLEKYGMSSYIEPVLLIETSRGCWWGQKKHCTFCGLNGQGMTYRSKSPKRVIEEFSYLSERYKLRNFEIVDNIVDLKYIDTVMPILESLDKPYMLFLETKANLKRKQVEQLAKAGVKKIQPGIENMHNEALKLLNKGTTAEINVQLLKWCKEFGIKVSWNYLLNIPGELDEWNQEVAEWFPLIFHLQPPRSGVIRFDRYSIYHEKAEDYDLKLVPNRLYSYVYPLPINKLMDLAYYFETEENQAVNEHPYKLGFKSGQIQLTKTILEWRKQQYQNQKNQPVLSMLDNGSEIRIIDTRPCAIESEQTLTNLAYWIYKSCDEIKSPRQLLVTLKRNYKDSLSWDDIQPVIEELLQKKILLQLNGKFLSLAVNEPFPTRFPILQPAEIGQIKLALWKQHQSENLNAQILKGIPRI